jgi:hypothetical protein
MKLQKGGVTLNIHLSSDIARYKLLGFKEVVEAQESLAVKEVQEPLVVEEVQEPLVVEEVQELLAVEEVQEPAPKRQKTTRTKRAKTVVNTEGTESN